LNRRGRAHRESAGAAIPWGWFRAGSENAAGSIHVLGAELSITGVPSLLFKVGDLAIDFLDFPCD
jgi:hypothetical protein